MSQFNANDYSRPRNFTEARKFAQDFGFIIRRLPFDGTTIQVYEKGLDRKLIANAVNTYETNNVDDAWDTMLSMWRAKNTQKRNAG